MYTIILLKEIETEWKEIEPQGKELHPSITFAYVTISFFFPSPIWGLGFSAESRVPNLYFTIVLNDLILHSLDPVPPLC